MNICLLSQQIGRLLWAVGHGTASLISAGETPVRLQSRLDLKWFFQNYNDIQMIQDLPFQQQPPPPSPLPKAAFHAVRSNGAPFGITTSWCPVRDQVSKMWSVKGYTAGLNRSTSNLVQLKRNLRWWIQLQLQRNSKSAAGLQLSSFCRR